MTVSEQMRLGCIHRRQLNMQLPWLTVFLLKQLHLVCNATCFKLI